MGKPRAAQGDDLQPIGEVLPRPGTTESGKVVLFNKTSQVLLVTAADGKSQVTIQPKSRITLDEVEVSEEMKRQVRHGRLERE